MKCLSDKEVYEFFLANGEKYINAAGILFFVAGNKIFCQLEGNYQNEQISFIIHTMDYSLKDFIEQFHITSLKQIDQLDYFQMWMRYQNGQAEICAWTEDLSEYEALTFKLHHEITMIFSSTLHFYDEEYQHIITSDDFAGYFKKKERLIHHYLDNRYYEC